jgi:ABC-type phosphate transport system substrate-binding protein
MVVVGIMLWFSAEAIAASYVVIANKSVEESSLTRAELKAIFLGEKVKWESRKYIKIVVLGEGPSSVDFLQSILGKTPSQFDAHWSKLLFSGKGSMPQTFAEPPKVVDFVAKNPNSIGFVPAGQQDASVKTITIK